MHFLKKHSAFLLFISVYFCLIAWKIVTQPTPFFDWDEAIYIQIGREMVHSGTFIPTWQGKVWLDKPPLIPFLYGLTTLIPMSQPEVTARLFTLIVGIFGLAGIYLLYKRVLKDQWSATLIVVLLAFTPIFVQRAQVLNIDVFVLLGWVGFILFYQRFWISFAFLCLAVLSKSLLGFYPIIIMTLFFSCLTVLKKITWNQCLHEFKKLSSMSLLISSYYIIMILLYGKAFWIQHIYESHFRRVTASLESHFGHITYYVDVIAAQFTQLPLVQYTEPAGIEWLSAIFYGITLVSFGLLIWQFLFKKLTAEQLLSALYLMPWFIFLNVTKTKIAWYAYPAIPQFSFLLAYPIIYLKFLRKSYPFAVAFLIIFITIYHLSIKNVLAQNYSKLEPYQLLAIDAKKKCQNLEVLVDPATRNSFETLEKMNLLISTSKWWGTNPSMVYYFEKPVKFYYTLDEFNQTQVKSGNCIAFQQVDKPNITKAIPNTKKEFLPWILVVTQ